MPDFYQGTELWDFSLVDPDNRRPVDFARRRQLLEEVDQMLALDVEANASRRSPRSWTRGTTARSSCW